MFQLSESELVVPVGEVHLKEVSEIAVWSNPVGAAIIKTSCPCGRSHDVCPRAHSSSDVVQGHVEAMSKPTDLCCKMKVWIQDGRLLSGKPSSELKLYRG